MFPPSRLIRGGLLAIVAIVGLGCSTTATSFDPSSACTTDGRFAGAYPDLEALVPRTIAGHPADRLDSGRNCSGAALATLVAHGVSELRFAGGLWERGSRSGTTLVVFGSPGPLQAAWLAEFYEAGARAARKTESVETSEVDVHGSSGRRIDTLNDDSFQTVVVWKQADHVAATLVASDVHETTREAHEAAVGAAIAAFGPAA